MSFLRDFGKRLSDAVSGAFDKAAGVLEGITGGLIDKGYTRDDYSDSLADAFSDASPDDFGTIYDKALTTLQSRRLKALRPDDYVFQDNELLPSNRPLKNKYRVLGEVIYVDEDTGNLTSQVMGFDFATMKAKDVMMEDWLAAVIANYPHLAEQVEGLNWYDAFIDPREI